MSDDDRRLFLGGLSFNTTDDVLKKEFEKYGRVDEARVVTDRETNRSRGFGFVSFADARDADDARKAMDNQELDGRTIHVSFARKREGGGGGGGFGGDRGGDRGGSGGGRACYDFQRGTCTRGSSCKFEHDGAGGSGGGRRDDRGGYGGGDRDRGYGGGDRGGDRGYGGGDRGGYGGDRGGDRGGYGGGDRDRGYGGGDRDRGYGGGDRGGYGGRD